MKPKEFPTTQFEDVAAELLLEESIYDEVEDSYADAWLPAPRRDERAGWDE
jgi:hypothetical protein